jgi:hypothetical protein
MFDTTAMIANATPDAITAYSIAVAPDSSSKKRINEFFTTSVPHAPSGPILTFASRLGTLLSGLSTYETAGFRWLGGL